MLEDFCHYLMEWHTGIDFIPGGGSQQWFDGLLKLHHASDFLWTFSIRIVRPAGQSLHNHLDWRGQEDDVVELRVELPLIRGAPAKKQHIDIVCG